MACRPCTTCPPTRSWRKVRMLSLWSATTRPPGLVSESGARPAGFQNSASGPLAEDAPVPPMAMARAPAGRLRNANPVVVPAAAGLAPAARATSVIAARAREAQGREERIDRGCGQGRNDGSIGPRRNGVDDGTDGTGAKYGEARHAPDEPRTYFTAAPRGQQGAPRSCGFYSPARTFSPAMYAVRARGCWASWGLPTSVWYAQSSFTCALVRLVTRNLA